jgi:hypothetical protein
MQINRKEMDMYWSADVKKYPKDESNTHNTNRNTSHVCVQRKTKDRHRFYTKALKRTDLDEKV